jgi:hypothetical protein
VSAKNKAGGQANQRNIGCDRRQHHAQRNTQKGFEVPDGHGGRAVVFADFFNEGDVTEGAFVLREQKKR